MEKEERKGKNKNPIHNLKIDIRSTFLILSRPAGIEDFAQKNTDRTWRV